MKSKIIRIGAIALIILFFIPFFSVSCSNQTIAISGVEMTFGKQLVVMGQSAGFQAGSIIMILLLLIPIGIAIISFSKKFIKLEGIIAAVSSVVYFILVLVAYQYISDKAKQNFSEFRPEIGFYLSVLINIVIIAAVAYDIYQVKNKTNSAKTIKPGVREDLGRGPIPPGDSSVSYSGSFTGGYQKPVETEEKKPTYSPIYKEEEINHFKEAPKSTFKSTMRAAKTADSPEEELKSEEGKKYYSKPNDLD